MADDANVQRNYPQLKAGMEMRGADGKPIGRVIEVLHDVGAVESFGAEGVPPQQEGFDAERYGYSEALPGAGDSYFVARSTEHGVLYVPFAAIQAVEGDQVQVAVDAASVGDMGWDARPDVLAGQASDYPEDGGAKPLVA